MIRIIRNRLTERYSGRFAVGSLIFFSATLLVNAQTITPGAVKPDSPTTAALQTAGAAAGKNIDEVFELNIVERHYDEQNFAAATAITSDAIFKRLSLQIGVALSAKKINVVLRNITGVVRFRGTLDRVLQVINDRPRLPAADAQVLPD